MDRNATGTGAPMRKATSEIPGGVRTQLRVPGPWAAALAALLLCCPPGLAAATSAPGRDPFAGRVAIVTGTSSGLGAELARLGAERNMRLVLVDIVPGPSRAMAERIEADGGEALFVQADLADPAQRGRIVAATLERFGTVDFLFNNAGYSYLARLDQMDLAQAHHLFEVNYWAYVDLADRVLPIMKAQGDGTLVNIASILGVVPGPPGLGHYAATKHALVGMFQVAARELEAHGIDVYVACPGGMRTNIARNSVGPLAQENRERADDWQDPAVPAADIFAAIEADRDEVLIYPGYVEAPERRGG